MTYEIEMLVPMKIYVNGVDDIDDAISIAKSEAQKAIDLSLCLFNTPETAIVTRATQSYPYSEAE